MPKLGDVKPAKEIGRKKGVYIWAACGNCGKERWAELIRGLPRRQICHPCAIELRIPPYTRGASPKLGDIAKAREIGYKGTGRYIYHACIACGKERWVPFENGKASKVRCLSCAAKTESSRQKKSLYASLRIGSLHSSWKGGRKKQGEYIMIWLDKNDPLYPMATKRGYILEHRLVVARALGRCLLPWEVVHHRTGYAKDDNRYPLTLELITDKRFHLVDMVTQGYIKRLEKRIEELENSLTEGVLTKP